MLHIIRYFEIVSTESSQQICLCMWQRGVWTWTNQVKCAAGTSSRMIYLFYFTDFLCYVLSAVCCSWPSRLFCLTPNHWLHLCPGASGDLASDHTPAPLAHYGAGGKQTAAMIHQRFVDINLCISHWSIIALHCFLFDSFLLKDSFILILHQSNLIRTVLESPQTSNRSLMLKFSVILMASML